MWQIESDALGTAQQHRDHGISRTAGWCEESLNTIAALFQNGKCMVSIESISVYNDLSNGAASLNSGELSPG